MRKILAFSLCLLFALIVSGAALAAGVRVFDEASLLDAGQKTELESGIADLRQKHKLDVVILTVPDIGSKSPEAFADDYYDQGGFGAGADNAGLLLLISLQSRDVYISTCGSAIDTFTDARLDAMIEHMTPDLSAGRYGDAAVRFVRDVFIYAAGGHNYPLIIGVGLAVGLLAAALVCAAAKRRYKTAAPQDTRRYLAQDSVRFLTRDDHFITSRLARVPLPQGGGGSGRSGGSSTHRSGGGVSHGGRGGKF